MPSLDACRHEVEELHSFFGRWYRGEATGDEFDRFAAALAPSFELITPDGQRVGRAAILESVRDQRGRDGDGAFEIEVRDVESVATIDDHALVRYEEVQTGPDTETRRISTALLRTASGAPTGLEWVHLQETWLDPP